MMMEKRSVWDWLTLVAKEALENENFTHLLMQIPITEEPMKTTLKRKLYDQLEENQMEFVGKTQRKKRPSTQRVTESPADLPRELRDAIKSMGGRDPVMVIHKNLFKSDVEKNEGRISMPVKRCESKLVLTDDEMKQLDVRDENGKLVGVGVRVIEPGLNQSQLSLKEWKYEKSSNYVLTNGWNEVVYRNKLTVGDNVQIWAFRIEGDLGFAVVKLPRSSKTQ